MKVFSFDVFDTILTRLVLKPKDVFHLLAERLIPPFFDLPVELQRHFWAERVWAEILAFRGEGTDALSIETIYAYLGKRYHLSADQQCQLIKAEIELEDELLVPVRGARRLLENARKRGQVIFISDMYFPEFFIASKLERLGLRRAGEEVYVSGTRGGTKRSGLLYRLVLDDLVLSPDLLTHYGDHSRDDVRVPAGLGIRVAGNTEAGESLVWRKKLTYAFELLRAFQGLGRN